jgi:hypothetical protein
MMVPSQWNKQAPNEPTGNVSFTSYAISDSRF